MDITDGEKTNFIWNSNRIDYNTVHPDDLTRSTVDRIVAHKAIEPTEIYSHYHALEWVITTADVAAHDKAHWKNISMAGFIKDIHKILMQKIAPQIAGAYRQCHVYIGTEQMLGWRMVPKYMLRLSDMIAEAKTEADAWAVHDEFECIHPFMDGNGRTGRLLLNYVRLRLDLPLLTVGYGRGGGQYQYYDNIRQYRATKFKALESTEVESHG
jgi:Fic family protein